MNTAFDGLEGQCPRCPIFEPRAAQNTSQKALPPKLFDPLAAHAHKNDFAVHDFANPETPLCG
jgi:hypothetical protein